MRRRTIFTVGSLVVAACSAGGKPPPSADSASATHGTSAPPAAGNIAADTVARWIVAAARIGPVRIGMTVDVLRDLAGEFAAPPGNADCRYVHPSFAPPGVSFMVVRDTVARIDVDSAGVLTDTGIGVGDSTSRVRAAYGPEVITTPHKYVAGGEYQTVRSRSPTDSSFRIVFESENGRVTRYRAGRVPEVEWVERCG